ncbi:sugar O-acetyltransferase [Cellulomonas sp.]|uniref:sugar O-acetyltransferase n=1 Tax=Cellulomonas sp. TaxID=40001 RepID=UPI002D6D910C|nr:sugar O-acetyltransferase [Cellulomonas sp.]HYQ73595.1 sugar O-acetyltransferase [Cellulomonas sp.]
MDDREREVRRRMAEHEPYTDYGPGLEQLEEERTRGKELVHEFNASHPRDHEGRQKLLRELLGSVGERVWVEPPLRAMYGNRVHLGDDVYVNVGLTLVDDVEVHVGSRVMFAPNVTVITTGHPVHPDLRRDGTQFSAPVRIEDDVWIGAGATILPGVTVGEGSVVGAGAVVTGNVPPRTVVAGVPARVLREITDADLEFRYRPPRDLA